MASAEAQAPLLASHPDEEDDALRGDEDMDGDSTDAEAVESEGLPSQFVWLLTLSAGISGFLFGYDTGIISATLISIGPSLSRPLTTLDKSLITSATSLLALAASPASSALADRAGRKAVILGADLLFAAGAAAQALAGSVGAMVVGRAVVGAGVGAASFVTPLYIGEAAPRRWRGALVTVNVVFITLGQVVAYLVGWGLSGGGGGWRWMVGLGALPALLQALLMLGLPESPRWLVRAGRSAEARSVVRRVVGGEEDGRREAVVEGILKAVEREVKEEEAERRRGGGGAGWGWRGGQLFGVRRNRRALSIACLLQGLQQLCGFNSLMYFSATIFALLGFRDPTLTSLTVAGTNFIFTLLALVLIDRLGRRRMLIWSIPFMVAGLLLAAYGFSRIRILMNTTTPRDGRVSDRSAATVILVSIMIYVAAYALGLGNVPWQQAELFALNVRSLGSGLATATNWLANFVIGLTFLPLMESLTPSWTFVLYGVICAVGYILIWRVYPETSGLSLEEAASLLDEDGWGVR